MMGRLRRDRMAGQVHKKLFTQKCFEPKWVKQRAWRIRGEQQEHGEE
jgi:hypothetical protein